MADLSGDITTAEKETVNNVGGVLAHGGVIETTLLSGIGGKGREKKVKIGLVGVVGGESGFIGTIMEPVSRCSFTNYVKEPKQGD